MFWNEAVETLDRRELEKLQLQRLQATLERAYTVPFHKEQFDQAGVRPAALQSLDDLTKFPFTKKSHLRDNYPFGLFAEPTDKLVRLHASSGTRGKPTVVGYTRQDIDTWAEVCARSIACAGGQPGDMLHVAYGYGLFTGGLGIHYGAEKLGACVVPASGGNTPRQVMLLQDFKAVGLACTPSYALNIADQMRELKYTPQDFNLKYGIFGAEPWTEEIRGKIEQELGLVALDIYGLSEVMGPGVSMECEQKQGLHIWEDHFLPEIVDPATGERLPEGETGELVFTSLTKEAFPVVRYRTGDLCALYYEPCPCGRTHARMSKIKGRIDDMFIVRGVNVFPSEIERVLLEFEELAPHYQIILTRPEHLDVVTVLTEVSSNFYAKHIGFAMMDHNHPAVDHLRGNIRLKLNQALGVSIEVQVTAPRTIARSEGKAVRVVDQRPR
ncbi:MAG: phenylacetate--CoA ligase [Chloroflexi bacterium]|nr:phenylacetate--CoA ligase [Chloroflexota bacterium]OJV95276.1 MAG: phenylacetate--CoA ligase [Chloroflexi bacterium 54-19]